MISTNLAFATLAPNWFYLVIQPNVYPRMRFEKLPAQNFTTSFEELRCFQNEVKLPTIYERQHTVDGKYPAPVDMVNIPLFTGFYTSQMVVWDFWTINTRNSLRRKKKPSGFPQQRASAGKLTETYQHHRGKKIFTKHQNFHSPKKVPSSGFAISSAETFP